MLLFPEVRRIPLCASVWGFDPVVLGAFPTSYSSLGWHVVGLLSNACHSVRC
jgi:hypothetical protein